MNLGLPIRERKIIEAMVTNRNLTLLDLSFNLRRNIENINTSHYLYLAFIYGRNYPDLERVENNNNLTINIYAN